MYFSETEFSFESVYFVQNRGLTVLLLLAGLACEKHATLGEESPENKKIKIL